MVLETYLLALSSLPIHLTLTSVPTVLEAGLPKLGRRPSTDAPVTPTARASIASSRQAALLSRRTGEGVEGICGHERRRDGRLSAEITEGLRPIEKGRTTSRREGGRQRVGAELVHVRSTDEQRRQVRRDGRHPSVARGSDRVHAHHEGCVVADGKLHAVGRVGGLRSKLLATVVRHVGDVTRDGRGSGEGQAHVLMGVSKGQSVAREPEDGVGLTSRIRR